MAKQDFDQLAKANPKSEAKKFGNRAEDSRAKRSDNNEAKEFANRAEDSTAKRSDNNEAKKFANRAEDSKAKRSGNKGNKDKSHCVKRGKSCYVADVCCNNGEVCPSCNVAPCSC